MKHAVADAAERGAEREHRVIRGESLDEHAGDDERHAAEEHATRAVAVDDETGERLQQAGKGVEERDEKSERRVRHAELVLDEREKRREQELVEVAHAVRERDEPDDGRVASHLKSRTNRSASVRTISG
jgi:hypothetical protein